MDLRILVEPQEGATYDDQLACAQLTEELGFDGFFRTDHYLPIGLGTPQPTTESSDAWTSLAGLARETQRIKLGTLVTAATYRLPGPLAVTVSQVDAMSGGRVELGIGAGWYEGEHRAYGVPFPDVRIRFDRLEETLQILTQYWQTQPGQTFSFEGQHFQFVDCPASARPVQPAVPIILGGHGKPRTLRLAARWASEFNFDFPRPGVVEQVRPKLAAACEAIGRDPDSIVFSAAHLVCVGADQADLLERAEKARLDLSLNIGGLIGTVPEVRAMLDALAAAGIQRFYCQIPDIRDEKHLRLLATLFPS